MPSIRVFSNYLHEHMTLWGAEDFLISLTQGLISNTLAETWSLLEDPLVMHRLDSKLDIAITARRTAADDEKAVIFFNALRNLSFQFIMWEVEFTHVLPNALAPLARCERG